MMNKKYTAAIIGTGRIGFTLGFDKKREAPASHTMAMLQNKSVQIIAGCDVNSKSLQKWAAYTKCNNIFTSEDELYQNIKADIIVIAVNEDSHLQSACKAILTHPKLVILEKPVALNSEEGFELKNISEKENVPVLVNHERRFSYDYKIAKEYIKKLGFLQTVNARLDSSFYVYNPQKEKNGEYSLLHDGTHLVDIVLYLLDDKSLNNLHLSSIHYDEKDISVVRNLNIHAESHICSDINLFFSGRSHFFGFEVEFIGTEGRFRIGNGIFEFRTRKKSKLYTGFYSLLPDRTVKRPKKTGYFSNMIQNAVDFLDKKQPLYSSLQTGLDTLVILESIKSLFISL